MGSENIRSIECNNHSYTLKNRLTKKESVLSGEIKNVGGHDYRIIDVKEERGLLSRSFNTLVSIFRRYKKILKILDTILFNKEGSDLIKKEWSLNKYNITYIAIPIKPNVIKIAKEKGLVPPAFIKFCKEGTPPIFNIDTGETRNLTSDMFDDNSLYGVILERREMLFNQKKSMCEAIKASQKKNLAQHEELAKLKEKGKFEPMEDGLGGAYLLKDSKGNPKYIIKPNDEETNCINNRKNYASIYYKQVRENIPNYQSVQNEALASRVSEHLGIPDIIPKTVMLELENEEFHDLMDNFSSIPEDIGLDKKSIDKNKLCSAQKFVLNSEELEKFQQGMSPQDLYDSIDQQSFENANILVWTILENDAHAGNFLVVPIDDTSKNRLVKIDSGLSFPEKNTGLSNSLADMQNAMEPLSEETKKIIENIPIKKITKEMILHGKSQEAVTAFKKRIVLLKSLAKHKGETIASIDKKLKTLCDKESAKDG